MILRKQVQSDFTHIYNTILKDKNLTNEMVGVMCRVLSLPDEWHFNMKGLCTVLNISHAGVNRILKQLALYGYFKRDKYSLGEQGFRYIYNFYDVSRLQDYLNYYEEGNFAKIYTPAQLMNLLPEEYLKSIRGI